MGKALDLEDGTVAQQMFRLFDQDGGGFIELKEFVVVLSGYTTADRSEKLKFAFMMFDEDGSGFVDCDELINMLAASFVVEGNPREVLQYKAEIVYEYLQLEYGSPISYEDFMKLAATNLVSPVEE